MFSTKKNERRGRRSVPIGRAVLVLTMLSAAYAGCDAMRDPNPDDFPPGEIPTGGSLTISYDQESKSFVPLWPGDVVAGPDGARTDGDEGAEMLVDYDLTRETLAYDEDGYLTSEIEYLDGDAALTMPPDLYEEVKHEMPAHDADYDPVVREVLVGSQVRRYGQSGALLSSAKIDPERVRLTSAQQDSLAGGETGNRIARNLSRLAAAGLSPTQWNEHYAAYDQDPNAEDQAAGVGKMRYVVDLRYGQAVRSAVLDEQGRYRFLMLRTIEEVNGYPVPVHTERYRFGNVNGEWGLVRRTIEHRTNVRVERNG